MNDKEKIIETLAVYAGTLTNSLIGFNLGTASSALVKIGINNMLSKEPYKRIVDFMFDDNNNLPDKQVFWNAIKESIDQKPIVIANLKFNKKDIEEIENLFNQR